MPANVESMFYVGDMPWHREGRKLIDPPTTSEAIIMAGLDWEVQKTQLFTNNNQLVKNYYGIMRMDSHEVLGVVGKGYTPLQNKVAFSFFDPLLDQKFLEYETAGSLGEGEIIWVLAKIKNNHEFRVKGDDIVQKYLLLSNSHDGKSAVSVKFTPIRVVCQNTLSLALSQGETTRIKHVVSMHDKLNDVQMAIENIMNIYSTVEDKFKGMYEFKMDEEGAKNILINYSPYWIIKTSNLKHKGLSMIKTPRFKKNWLVISMKGLVSKNLVYQTRFGRHTIQ